MHTPPERAFVLRGAQLASARFVQASITTEPLVAQEITKARPLGPPQLALWLSMSGFGSHHGAVGSPQKVVPQPAVPGR